MPLKKSCSAIVHADLCTVYLNLKACASFSAAWTRWLKVKVILARRACMHCTLSTGNDTVAQLPSGLIWLIYYKPYDCIWPSIRTLVFFQKAKWRQRAVIRLTNSLVPELTISFCFSIVALMPRFFFFLSYYYLRLRKDDGEEIGTAGIPWLALVFSDMDIIRSGSSAASQIPALNSFDA